MTVAAPPTKPLRRPVTPTTFRRLCVASLAMLIIVTVAGAVVRLSGSGLGCETWPACDAESFTPHGESDIHAVIEFLNRMVSGVVGVVALAALIGAYRRAPRRDDLVAWSWVVLGWVVVNALVGAAVVETDLVPAVVIVHFLLAMAAVASAVVLLHRAGLPDVGATDGPDDDGTETPDKLDEPGNPRRAQAAVGRHPELSRPAQALVAATLLTVVLGTLVTGTGPHAGDEAADRLNFDIDSVARLHGFSTIALLLITIWFATRARRALAPTDVHDRVRWLTFALLTQAAIGYTQYLTGVPPMLVGAHVVGAALVWVAALLVWLSVQQGPRPDRPGDLPAEARTA